MREETAKLFVTMLGATVEAYQAVMQDEAERIIAAHQEVHTVAFAQGLDAIFDAEGNELATARFPAFHILLEGWEELFPYASPGVYAYRKDNS